MTTVFSAAKIFDGEAWSNKAIVVQDGKVQELIAADTLPSQTAHRHFDHCFIAPAFIDIQIYGAYGKLLAVYPNPESLAALHDYCRKGGATLHLPTVATNTKDVFYACIDAVRAYWQGGGSGVWGLHLEGPWINKEKRGAHVESCIHVPTMAEVEELLAYGKGVIKMITLAPEMCSPEVIELIRAEGITLSAGHTNATFEEAMIAFDSGIGAATHLYNAMSPLQHRAPGVVGACLLHHKVKASVIPDGYHVDFAAIKIAKGLMGERLFAITDAVTETAEGHYHHQLIGDRYECNGTLSGSALTMHQSFRNLVEQADISIEEALRMCSLYPAQVIAADHLYGKIAPGYAAQFAVLNTDLELVEVLTA